VKRVEYLILCPRFPLLGFPLTAAVAEAIRFEAFTVWEKPGICSQLLDTATSRLAMSFVIGEHGLRATFAFVGAYTLSAEAFLDRRVEYEPLLSSSWCRVFAAALQRGQLEGWFNAEAARLVARAGGHEIAGHGFSHRPLTPADATRDEVRWELDALRRLDLFHDQSWTLVYPRNQIGYVDELGGHGIVGYRERRQHAFGRAGALLSELNVVAAAEPHASDEAAIRIPAGFFLNWRSGGRRMVPLP
jgi:hypothetical protein